jgi:hypothetical protein
VLKTLHHIVDNRLHGVLSSVLPIPGVAGRCYTEED